MKNGSNMYERPVTELVEFIRVHQPISFVLIFIDNSLRVVVCSVWSSVGDVKPECLWLSDIELLLVAFDSQLKVFHQLKNDNTKIAQAEKPPLSFNELMSTPIDFSTYVMNHLKIDNLTQDHLVRPVCNLLKGTCKSRVELAYNIEECYKAFLLATSSTMTLSIQEEEAQAGNIRLP
nr:hypothetical protein [Tanacetum cinerariifolium]